ncbi:hypothetical protein EDD15DRAFT_2194711 [Pisolithus albus]|nr:hypothetical protein EDD15DRAFT_2194711 [Pisolithus albus]
MWRGRARLDPDRVLNAIKDIYENEKFHRDIHDDRHQQTGGSLERLSWTTATLFLRCNMIDSGTEKQKQGYSHLNAPGHFQGHFRLNASQAKVIPGTSTHFPGKGMVLVPWDGPSVMGFPTSPALVYAFK